MPKRKISDVWRWFGKSNDKKFAKCNTCGKEYKTSGNTSNLLDHVKRSHSALLKEASSSLDDVSNASSNSNISSSSSSISHYFSRQNSYENNSSRKKELDKALVFMIASDFQPFDIVQDKGFRKFVNLLDPKYNLPSKGTLRNKYLVNLYEEVKVLLKAKLQETNFVSVTCDLWTSRANESYMTVTCHFFDSMFEYRSAVLSTSYLHVNHTADNLALALKEVFCSWEIQEKVTCIVTDNASNILKACEVLRIRNMPCFAHTLNLVVQDALKDEKLAIILKKCKEIVSYVKHSNVATENLKKEQRDMNKPVLKLIQEVPTRWNSALFMIERLLAVHGPLTLALSKTTKSPPPLTADDILALEDVVEVLQPFDSATKKLSGDSYITVSLVIPVIFDMYTKISEANMKSDVGNYLLQCLLSGIRIRLFPYEERTVCRLATLLDPRLKKEAFRSTENCKAAISILQNELPSHVISSTETSVPLNEGGEMCSGVGESSTDYVPDSFQFGFMEKRLQQKQRSKSVDTIILLRQYFERANTKTDPLLFWKVNGHEFAPLQRCAMKYLCVPATSVPSERIFSKAGQIVSNRRASIKAKNVDMLIFLNQNKWLIL